MANETVNQSDAHENLTAKLTQLRALLAMTFGGAAEVFNGMGKSEKDAYLSGR